MALETAATEQAWLITVSVNGQALGVFDTFTGGDASAPSIQHRPGGMGPQRSYATLVKYSNITASRVLEPQRDWELIRSLKDIAGRVDASLTEQPLDADGNPWGSPKVYQGSFLGVKPGKTDSNSDALRMFEIDMSVNVVA